MNNELTPARFLITDNRKIGGDQKIVSFMFGYFQLFIYLKLENEPQERKDRFIKSLERGAPALISHYTVIKDLFYKGDF